MRNGCANVNPVRQSRGSTTDPNGRRSARAKAKIRANLPSGWADHNQHSVEYLGLEHTTLLPCLPHIRPNIPSSQIWIEFKEIALRNNALRTDSEDVIEPPEKTPIDDPAYRLRWKMSVLGFEIDRFTLGFDYQHD
jgi:hypothetical protein